MMIGDMRSLLQRRANWKRIQSRLQARPRLVAPAASTMVQKGS
ncbi:hypothetical protein D516_1688 [Rhodobacter sp. AKP1]|nr:hypothetical protein D516_1688 [Rhodobacter sp. AKP1]